MFGIRTLTRSRLFDPVQRMLDLHITAVQELARQAGNEPSPSDEAVILLGCHAYNLVDSLFQLLTDGRFDVALYLLRPLWDASALIVGAGISDELADDMWSGRLKASNARKII